MKKGALLIPQCAVAQLQGSYQVKPGETVATMWVIESGLRPGEQVVVEGLQRVKEGTFVTTKPAQLSGEGN